MRRWITVAFTFGVCALPSRGAAEPRASATPMKHAKGSSSGKKKNALGSIEERYTTLIALADTNGDGEVSSGEIEQLVQRYVQKRVQARFDKLDRNGDGRVTRAEVPTMLQARFERFDGDGDGSFTLHELAMFMHGQAIVQCRTAFARLDLDGDGALSRHDAESASPTRVSQREAPTPAKTQ